MDLTELPDLMTRQQAADYMGVTPQALSQMNVRGEGPRFVRIGRSVRYRRPDIAEWIESRVVDPTTLRVS